MSNYDTVPEVNNKENSKKAIAWALSHFFLASAMIAVIRYLYVAEDLHPNVTFFFRNLLSLPFVIAILASSKWKLLKINRLNLHISFTVANYVAIALWFYVVTVVPLSEAVALNFTAPLFAVLIAILVLKENVNFHRWFALLLGFAGVIVILRPGLAILDINSLLVIVVSLFMGASAVLMRKLVETNSPLSIVCYSLIISTPISLFFAMPFFEMPDNTAQWLWLLLLAIGGILLLYTFSKALEYASVSKLAPFDFSRLVFTSVIAFTVFSEIPDIYTVAGGIIIVFASSYAAYYDRLNENKA